MQNFLIERHIPGAGRLSTLELQAISRESCDVHHELGPAIRWMRRSVTGDVAACVYRAESEELVRTHARIGGFPAAKVLPIAHTISPATAMGGQGDATVLHRR